MPSITVDIGDVSAVCGFLQSGVREPIPAKVTEIIAKWEKSVDAAHAASIQQSIEFYEALRRMFNAYQSAFSVDGVTYAEVKDAVVTLGLKQQLCDSWSSGDGFELEFIGVIPKLCAAISMRRAIV